MTQLSGKQRGRVFFALGAVLIVIAAVSSMCGGGAKDTPAATTTRPVAPAAPTPPRPVVKTVKSIGTVADLQFTDGSRLRLRYPKPNTTSNSCIRSREIAAARKLLTGQRVSILDNARTNGPEVTLSGNRDYEIELSKATFGDAGRCGVNYPPSSGGSGFNLGGDDDDHHHSRRYCRKHRHRC